MKFILIILGLLLLIITGMAVDPFGLIFTLLCIFLTIYFYRATKRKYQ